MVFVTLTFGKRKTCETSDIKLLKSAQFKLIVLCFVRLLTGSRAQMSLEQKRICLTTNLSSRGSHQYPVETFSLTFP